MATPVEEVLAFLQSFPGVDIQHTSDAHFVYYDPDRTLDRTKHHPFATVVVKDTYDQLSDLETRGAYRLSIGVPIATYRKLFRELPQWNKSGGPVATGHDWTALDVVTPQPFYAPLGWISVNSPGKTNWEWAKLWIAEAYAKAKAGYP